MHAQERTPMDKITLRPKEAARALGLSPSTLAKMRMRGEGPAYVRASARCVLYRLTDIDTWLKERTRRATGG